MIGQRGWIRTTDLLHPRQAGTARLPYTLIMTGAHGRTRTCTSPARNQALYPVELRVPDWCRDGDSNSGLLVENRPILATRPKFRGLVATWDR